LGWRGADGFPRAGAREDDGGGVTRITAAVSRVWTTEAEQGVWMPTIRTYRVVEIDHSFCSSELVINITGIRLFAECRRLCRVLFIGHSAKPNLPSAALGKVLRSVNSLFTECRTLGTAKHSAKTALSSVMHSANMALGKEPLAAVYS
jgi:hypothetical protein